MKQPEAYVDFVVYEDSKEMIGVASATLPNLSYLTQNITGAGISGSIDAVLTGMVDAMELTLNFRGSGTVGSLAAPKKHQIDLRAAEQYWDTAASESEVIVDKYVMVVIPKGANPGDVAPASAANTSMTFSVYYYAGYHNGELMWEIDPFNQVCNVAGVDYLADMRKAMGKA